MGRNERNQRETLQAIREHVTQRHSIDSMDEPSRYFCDLCGTQGFGQRLSCAPCGLAFHLICLHPDGEAHGMSRRFTALGSHDCAVCHKKTGLLSYHCEAETGQDGDGWVHPICFQLRQRKKDAGGKKLQTVTGHISHPAHPLKEIYTSSQYLCKGCGSGGFGLRFRCEDCDFDLHHYCATCPPTERCLEHPKHKMKIQVIADDQVSQRYDCVVCGDTITRCADGVVGLRYGCKSSSVAHPLCVQLQRIQNPSSIGRRVGKAVVNVFISGTRSVVLNSIGVPDFFAAWDAFDALYTIWDLVSSAKEMTSAFSDEPTFLGELQALDATDVLGDLSGTAVEDDNFQVLMQDNIMFTDILT